MSIPVFVSKITSLFLCFCLCVQAPALSRHTLSEETFQGESRIGPDFRVMAETGRLSVENGFDSRFFCAKETRDVPGAAWVREHRVYASGFKQRFFDAFPGSMPARHIVPVDAAWSPLRKSSADFKEIRTSLYLKNIPGPAAGFFTVLERPPQLR